jgi:hypothetical protein
MDAALIIPFQFDCQNVPVVDHGITATGNFKYQHITWFLRKQRTGVNSLIFELKSLNSLSIRAANETCPGTLLA